MSRGNVVKSWCGAGVYDRLPLSRWNARRRLPSVVQTSVVSDVFFCCRKSSPQSNVEHTCRDTAAVGGHELVGPVALLLLLSRFCGTALVTLRGWVVRAPPASVVRCKDRRGHTVGAFRFCSRVAGVVRNRRLFFSYCCIAFSTCKLWLQADS